MNKGPRMVKRLIAVLFFSAAMAPAAQAVPRELGEAQAFYRDGQYFKAARYAYDASQEDPSCASDAYSWMTLGLARSGLYNSAAYFFIRTLQSGNKNATRRALGVTQELLVRVGADLLRKYLIRHTAYEDYDELNRSAYLYALGRSVLLEGQAAKAAGYFSGMSRRSPLWPFALQLRASANAISGKLDGAIQDYAACASDARSYVTGGDSFWRRRAGREADDLHARCIAGQARVLYEQGRFDEADRMYDRVPKASIVWTDILFEQAWNAFGRGEFNRSLGKLVSYKSPALSFVFNTETDVLRAQSYLMMCLYSDANEVVNEFNSKYARVGQEVKHFVERNSSNLAAFYDAGAQALRAPISTKNEFFRMMNRFVRGPYFQNMAAAEQAIGSERQAVARFDSMMPGVSHRSGRGFPGFLDLVLEWRMRTVRLLGGAFVKNSLIDHYSKLLSDFDKMSFIKLEMLGRAKEKLLYKKTSGAGGRDRGGAEPSRRDDQYKWSFNGEFWNDELGDYVFGLESECGK